MQSSLDNNINTLCIAAHQDDVEFMAFGAIHNCITNGSSFGAVIVADGGGSPRDGEFKNFTDGQMKTVRKQEQQHAAIIGKYSYLAQLDFCSADIKNVNDKNIVNKIYDIILELKPEVIYTHNPADKHITHVAVLAKTLQAIRMLPMHLRPKQMFGCEVWRDLDWVLDEQKIQIDVSKSRELGMELMQVFKSQIAGGKKYDLATDGRRYANATYSRSHSTDAATQICNHIDMTALLQNDTLTLTEYITQYIDNFKNDVLKNIQGVTKDE